MLIGGAGLLGWMKICPNCTRLRMELVNETREILLIDNYLNFFITSFVLFFLMGNDMHVY